MPVSLTALIATALHQARSATADPAELEESVQLVVRAGADGPLRCEVIGGRLQVNGVSIAPTAPGAEILIDALTQHYTSRLELPAGLTAREWGDVVSLYTSAPGLYGAIDKFRDAVRASIPGAVVVGVPADDGIDLREAMFELPGLRTEEMAAHRPLAVPHPDEEQRTRRAAALDSLLDAATSALAHRDLAEFARALLEIHQLEVTADAGGRAVISRERRRVAPADALDALVRALPVRASPPILTRAAVTIGRDGAEALLRALDGASGLHERRTYIDALVKAREGDAVVLDALGSERPQLVRDAAEIIGRRQMEYAVPALAQLLRHREEEVRTAAWHALEQIGTRESAEALRRSR